MLQNIIHVNILFIIFFTFNSDSFQLLSNIRSQNRMTSTLRQNNNNDNDLGDVDSSHRSGFISIIGVP